MNRLTLAAVAALSFLVTTMLAPPAAFAGDDAQEILTFPTTNDGGVHAGVHVISARYDKRNIAVQCYGSSSTGMYVRPVSVADGGQLARVTDVYVACGKLYDTPTTGDKPYIAIRGVDGGVPTSATIFLHRERGE